MTYYARIVSMAICLIALQIPLLIVVSAQAPAAKPSSGSVMQRGEN